MPRTFSADDDQLDARGMSESAQTTKTSQRSMRWFALEPATGLEEADNSPRGGHDDVWSARTMMVDGT